MTEGFAADRGRFAAAEAARRIVDERSTGDHVRMLRDATAAVLAAMLDFDDTPAVDLIDEAVRFELRSRAVELLAHPHAVEALGARWVAAYDEMIERRVLAALPREETPR